MNFEPRLSPKDQILLILDPYVWKKLFFNAFIDVLHIV